MADTVTIELEVEASKALKNVSRFADDAQKQLSSISMASNFTAIAVGFKAVADVARSSFALISEAVSKSIEEASAAEQANVRLANSMRLVGDFSADALKGFEDLARQIQRTTVYSDDQVLAAAALAKGLGLTNSEVRKLLPVAANLAAKLQIDLGSAVEKLGRTFNGFVDKDLKKTFLGIDAFTASQKRAGAAVDFVASKVSGSASAITGTFSGAIQQATNSFNDIFEELGKGIIQTPELIAAIRAIGEQFGYVAIAIAKSAPTISRFIAGVIDMIAQMTILQAQGQKLISSFTNAWDAGLSYFNDIVAKSAKAIYDFIAAIYTLGAKAGDAQKSFQAALSSLDPRNLFRNYKEAEGRSKSFWDPIINGAKETQKAVANAATQIQAVQAAANTGPTKTETQIKQERELAAQRLQIAEQFEQKKKDLAILGLSEIQKVEKEAAENIKLVNQAKSFGIIRTEQERADFVFKIEKELAKKVTDLKKQEAEKQKADIQNFSTNIGGALTSTLREGKGITDKQQAAAATGLLDSMLKGAQGASKLISGFIGGIFDTILPGIGGVVGQIVEVLGQGPEKAKEMITGFVRAVPEFIKNLITAIPVLIVELSKAVPAIISGILDALPQIITALVQAMPQVALALSGQMPTIAVSFATGLIKNIPKMVEGFAQEFLRIPEQFVNEILSLIPGVGGKKKKGGISGFFESLNPFDVGGRVPDLPRYTGDRYPARLSAGEQVFSRDLSKKLENYLASRGNAAAPQVISVTIGQRELARALLDLNRSGFRGA